MRTLQNATFSCTLYLFDVGLGIGSRYHLPSYSTFICIWFSGNEHTPRRTYSSNWTTYHSSWREHPRPTFLSTRVQLRCGDTTSDPGKDGLAHCYENLLFVPVFRGSGPTMCSSWDLKTVSPTSRQEAIHAVRAL